MAVLARREAIVADDLKILNRVGDSERRFEVGTGRTGLHTLTALGAGLRASEKPASELQEIIP